MPLSLVLILALLYALFNSVRDSFIALSGIPFAVSGGILGLYVAGLNLSVSAAVGFISLFGVAAMDGILLVSYIRRDLEEGMDTETAIIQAGEARMRQVFMTGPVGLHRPGAGGDLHRHRLAGAAAAGLRDRRRHAAVADLQPAGDPDGGAAVHAERRRHHGRCGQGRAGTGLTDDSASLDLTPRSARSARLEAWAASPSFETRSSDRSSG